MLVDLINVTTSDGVRLDGIYQKPTGTTGPLDAVICVHGTGSNFYSSTLFDALAGRLLELGVGVLRVNTRGHDLMSTASTPRGGRRGDLTRRIVRLAPSRPAGRRGTMSR